MADKENNKPEEEAKEAKKAKAKEEKAQGAKAEETADKKSEEKETKERSDADEKGDTDEKVIASEDVDALESVPNPEDVEEELKAAQRMKEAKDAWSPKTSIGRKVKSGEIDDIDPLLDAGARILEPEITEFLLKGLETDLLLIGQSKGKFGGGQRRVFRQTQKKTREGNKPQFATIAVIGDKDGHVGIGYGKSRETVPAREKAIRKSKLNIFKIRRGSGSWESAATEPNSIPFKVTGSCGSTSITLIPAPKGTGLCVEKECAKILALAGIKDIWAKTSGQTKTKINLIMACEDALRKLSNVKILPSHVKDLTMVEGSVKGASNE